MVPRLSDALASLDPAGADIAAWVDPEWRSLRTVDNTDLWVLHELAEVARAPCPATPVTMASRRTSTELRKEVALVRRIVQYQLDATRGRAHEAAAEGPSVPPLAKLADDMVALTPTEGATVAWHCDAQIESRTEGGAHSAGEEAPAEATLDLDKCGDATLRALARFLYETVPRMRLVCAQSLAANGYARTMLCGQRYQYDDGANGSIYYDTDDRCLRVRCAASRGADRCEVVTCVKSALVGVCRAAGLSRSAVFDSDGSSSSDDDLSDDDLSDDDLSDADSRLTRE